MFRFLFSERLLDGVLVSVVSVYRGLDAHDVPYLCAARGQPYFAAVVLLPLEGLALVLKHV